MAKSRTAVRELATAMKSAHASQHGRGYAVRYISDNNLHLLQFLTGPYSPSTIFGKSSPRNPSLLNSIKRAAEVILKHPDFDAGDIRDLLPRGNRLGIQHLRELMLHQRGLEHAAVEHIINNGVPLNDLDAVKHANPGVQAVIDYLREDAGEIINNAQGNPRAIQRKMKHKLPLEKIAALMGHHRRMASGYG